MTALYINIAYTIFLFISGYLLIRVFRISEKSYKTYVALSYPFSAGLTAILVLIPIMLDFELTASLVISVEVAKTALILIIWRIRFFFLDRIGGRGADFSANRMLVALLLIVTSGSLLSPFITNDSAIFALYSKAILNGTVNAFPQVGVTSYGVFWAALNAAYSTLSGESVTVSISTAFGLSLILLVYQSATQRNKSEPEREADASRFRDTLLWTALLSTPMLFLMMVYPHSNLISSFYLFSIYILVSQGYTFSVTKSMHNVIIAVMICGFGMARMENGLILSLLLPIMAAHHIQFYSRLRLAIDLSICLLVIWYGYIYIASTKYSDVILNPMYTGFIIFSLFIGSFIARMVSNGNSIVSRLFYLHNSILICCVFITLFFIVSPTRGFTSLSSLAVNLFFLEGRWGLCWWIVAVIAIIEKIAPSERSEEIGQNILLTIGLVLVCVILMLSFFREPYRVGYGDSGNRLMIMCFPFFLVYTYRVVSKYVNTALNTTPVDRSPRS
jgi:hypothetical protein